ncbi:Ig-like domain-containing protein [Buttiauxella selenatireducens]|uniref:Ig-like domain-containing protein n=1 Tax=Buttiauxella selenatireducens TaxID=3073902 RepID=A0ABY9SII3_9ENTR|nr:Ig-like domain-containing protein [Buttiauxella sp. R73]WMY75847.1 Ig-like domain-containing protein [Buttiauxella sp. R73]
MKIKSINSRAVAFILFMFLSSFVKANANDLTGSTGIINGTPPVIYNDNNEAGKVSFQRVSETMGVDDELDITDIIKLSWTVADAEGDEEASLPTVEWICTDTSNNKRVLATGINQYVIHPVDKGCTVGVNIIPTTITGLPRENNAIAIKDISTYDVNDNIPTGPVNPHILNITSYIVAPLNNAATYSVPAGNTLHTAFSGAQIQLETDNVDEQIDEWTTTNPAIATVSNTGLVTIKAKGAFRITARHNEVKGTITFNPQKFFIFSENTKMSWYDAKAWCENQGYRLPAMEDLSTAKGKREVPSDALWQEWGSSIEDVPHVGSVFWSSDEMVADEDAYAYMYLSDGHQSSNGAETPEGVACIE